MKRIATLILLAYALGTPIPAQDESNAVIIGRYKAFHSSVFNEKFTFLEHLPESYDKCTKTYPVVFVLNSHQLDTFANAVATIERLSFERIPEMIIIGLSNTGRAAEFFPIRPHTDNPGGADTFQQFLEQELIPYVDKDYRTKNFRILVGQSNSGLFTLYSLAIRPSVFNAYIAASPSLGWCPEFMSGKFLNLFTEERMLERFVYINYGEHDYPELVNDSILQFIQIFEEKAPEQLIWKIELLKNEGHVAITSLNNGLLALFSDYLYPEEQKEKSLKAVIAHYGTLSEKYGFEVEPPEEVLFNLAFRQKQAKKLDESIFAFQTLLSLYPFSWRGHFFIAEVYMENDNLKSAKSHYLKALELKPDLEAAKKRLEDIEKKDSRSPSLT
jgi:predicted alpha/beta superfamily hydrolase